MIRLRCRDPKRQELWQHKEVVYSLVNLTIAPLEYNGTRATDFLASNFTKLMIDHYAPYIYEVAQLGTDVVIVGRYKTKREARSAIKSEVIYE